MVAHRLQRSVQSDRSNADLADRCPTMCKIGRVVSEERLLSRGQGLCFGLLGWRQSILGSDNELKFRSPKLPIKVNSVPQGGIVLVCGTTTPLGPWNGCNARATPLNGHDGPTRLNLTTNIVQPPVKIAH